MATDPITFRIQIILPKAFQLQENICLENVQTKERLLTKIEKAHPNLKKKQLMLLIFRHPLASTKKWTVGKEIYEKTIYLTKELEVVPI
jgi:hypothetical protein